MSSLSYGVGLFPTEPLPEIIRLAQLSEALGFRHLWIGDSHLIWREAYMNLAAMALNTSRVTLGTGVTNMEPRASQAQVIPDWLVDRFAIAGTPAECQARVEALQGSGIEQIAIIPYGVGEGDRAETLRAFASAVRGLTP